MKRRIKYMILVLSICLVFSCFAGCREREKKPSGQVTVGVSTDSTGDIVPYWSNGETDMAVYNLTTGYETVSMTKDMTYKYNNTVLDKHKAVQNADGSKTWTFKLKDKLLWSNGEKISARDYVFTILFWSCSQVADGLGAKDASYGLYFDGYKDFQEGVSDYFKGVHLIDDRTFSVTVAAERLPYYFELSLVSISPTYMKGWVPSDIVIEDDPEKGCRFSDNFNTDYIKDTVQSYRYNQTVFSGPYCLTGYDEGSSVYTLTANSNFLGNYEKQTPLIKTIVIKKVEGKTGIQELKAGHIDLLPKAAEAGIVGEGLEMCKNGEGFKSCRYERNGYGYIAFMCNNGATQFKEVRQAVAYLLDRNQFAEAFAQGYSTVVNGAYGLGMKEYEYNKPELEKLNKYSMSLDNAIKVLDEGGWNLDESGNPYTGTGVRYKEVKDNEIRGSQNTVVSLTDGRKLMKLSINWAASENNPVSDIIETHIEKGDFTAAGMEVKQTVMTFAEMYAKHFLNQNEDYYNMYNLATSHSTPVYNVMSSYSKDSEANTSHISDQDLEDLAADMLKVSPDDEKAYKERWRMFQKRYNEVLPSLPLYSNAYADFFSSRLSGYRGITDLWDWESQILYTRVINQ